MLNRMLYLKTRRHLYCVQYLILKVLLNIVSHLILSVLMFTSKRSAQQLWVFGTCSINLAFFSAWNFNSSLVFFILLYHQPAISQWVTPSTNSLIVSRFGQKCPIPNVLNINVNMAKYRYLSIIVSPFVVDIWAPTIFNLLYWILKYGE